MSKRVADGQGGADRYGGMDEDSRDSAMDPPRKATAAQLAKRSIKPLKGRPGSSRSSSPSKMSTSQSFPPNAPTNAPTFAPPQASSFNFGASTPSATSFTFGASPAPSAPASPAPAFNPFASMSAPSFSGEQGITAAEIHEIESAGPRLSREGKLDQLANIVRHSEPQYKDADLGGLNLSALPAAVQRKMLDFVRGKNEPVSLASVASFSLSRYTRANGPADSDAPPLFVQHMPQTYTHLPAFGEEHFMTNGSVDEAKLAQAAADPQMPCAWQTGIAALQSRLDEEKTGMNQIHSYKYFQPALHDSTFTPPAAASFNPDAFAYARPCQPFNSVEGAQIPFVKHPTIEQHTQHDMLDVPQSSNSCTNSQQAAAQFYANELLYQTQHEAPKSSFSFSSTAPAPAASTSFSFGASTTAAAPSLSQPDASSPFKGFGAAPASPAPSSGFKFGSTAEPAKKDDATPATSAFGGFGAPTTKKDETPTKAPASTFNFGGTAASPAPAASSAFSFGGAPASPAPATSSPSFNFGGAAASPAPATSSSFSFGASTAAPASPAPVSAFNLGAPTAAPAAPVPTPSFSFGATAEKKDETPKPPASAFNFGAAAAASPAAPPSPKPAEKKLPSFTFGAPAAPKPAEEVSYPSLDKASSQESSPAPTPSFSFGQTAAPAASSPFKPAAAPVAPESPRPQNTGLGSSVFGSAPAPQKPAESTFKAFGASASTPSQPTASTPAFGFGSSTTAQAPAPSSSSALTRAFATGVATPPASPSLQPSELGSSLIKQLNESLRAHLASADASQDWSAMMRFYLEQVADIRQENSAAPSTATIASSSAPKQMTAPLAPSSTRGEKRVADDEVTKDDDHSKRSKTSFSTSTFSSTTPTKPLSSTASLFDDILNSAEKPQTPQPSNVFSTSAAKTPAAPATAPPVKSNPFGNIVQKVSATPAPVAPKLGWVPPAGAQAFASPNPKPAAPAFQIPKFGTGSSTAAAPSFLGSFGQKAAEQEAKEREKRKEEDMDSDEDEEEWERKDAEKQAQKKADLLAASQALKFNVDTSKKTNSSASAVFSFGSTPSTANTSASSNIFDNLSGGKPDDEDNDGDTDEDEDVHAALANASPAKPVAGKSLFDRVSFDGEKEKNSDVPSASFKFSSFGSSDPASDNTWKDTNPIKFGASTATAGTTTPDGSPAKAPAPKFSFGGASQPAEKSSPFSGMFGAKPAEAPKPASSGSVFGAVKPSAPATGFSFGGSSTAAPSGLAPPSGSSVFASAVTSRATTPGATTTDAEGSAAESEPSDTPNDTQKDLTALTAEELATSDLVHEARSKVTKFVKEADNKWVNQGLGPIRILANKETSKPRILVRADPSGKVVLNFNLILNKDLYSIKNAKMVQLSVPAEDKKLETFMCTFKDGAKAKEFLDKVYEAIAKAQG